MQFRAICRWLLVANVAYCSVAAIGRRLPAWTMFETVERPAYMLSDRDGAPIDLHAYLPRNALLLTAPDVASVATFVCDKEKARGPFEFELPSRGIHRVLGAPDCTIDVP